MVEEQLSAVGGSGLCPKTTLPSTLRHEEGSSDGSRGRATKAYQPSPTCPPPPDPLAVPTPGILRVRFF